MPGLRLGGGWEFSLGPGLINAGAEAGWNYTGLTGDHRPADTANLFPLSLRAGYAYPLAPGLTVGAGLTGGVWFSNAGGDTAFTPQTGFRLDGEIPFPGSRAWGVFIEIGVDLLPQKTGLNVMPAIAAGARFRPRRRPPEAALLEAAPLEAAPTGEAPSRAAPVVEEPAAYVEMVPLTAPFQETPSLETPSLETMSERELRELVEAADIVTLPGGERGIPLSELTVYFPANSGALSAQTRAGLEKAAALLRRYPEKSFIVAGFTAHTGTPAGREAIALSRARAARSFLVERGVSAGTLTARGYGSALPAANNSSAKGRALNRRVEFFLVLNEPEGDTR
ncbi:MAG: OmpA family protein [Treponema sp.]|jgi:outer membrane protein OmpA-like peptidoglycan-associated protein|nr:OmpA family protein [Treponema sp.]